MAAADVRTREFAFVVLLLLLESRGSQLIEDVGVNEYKEHGHHITRGLLNRALADNQLQTKLKVLLREHGRNAFGDGTDGGAEKEVRFTFAVHELDESIAGFLQNRDGALWKAARRLAGGQEVCVLMDRGFSKDSGDPETHWHRDDEAVGLHVAFPGMSTVHAWIPLTAMTKEMGTLQYMRGTHRTVRSWLERFLASVWGSEFAWWALVEQNQDDNLELGDVAWHDGSLVHSAGANSGGGGVRDGYAVSFAFCNQGDCGGAIARASAVSAVCRAATTLFDPEWQKRHREGENDYAKIAITEPLSTQSLRFIWRSIFGALMGLAGHQLIMWLAKFGSRDKAD